MRTVDSVEKLEELVREMALTADGPIPEVETMAPMELDTSLQRRLRTRHPVGDRESSRNCHGFEREVFSMVSGLPDRALSYPEVESLNQSDAIGFVFPATPHSIQDDEDNRPRVYDLLITTGDEVAAVVYAAGEGWKVVGKTSPAEPKEAVVDDVIAYRGYDIEDEEKVLQFVTELYGAMDELANKE